jgi:hypothetical protein
MRASSKEQTASMDRKILIKAHLIAAAFFTPALIIIAISGGLYLLGIKGTITATPVNVPAGTPFNIKAQSLDDEVRNLLQQLNINHEFEYVKVSGNLLYTRPTSKTHYEINSSANGLQVQRNEPSLQKRLIELHKGHGPLLFKDFQKVMALALLFILVTGTWLGLAAMGLRTTTGISVSSGLVVFLVLVLWG